MNAYFITGATGAVGSAVAARLLREPDTRVVALVRAESHQAATRRLAMVLAPLGVTDVGSNSDSRVRALAGDVQQPRFGLADADHLALIERCSHIVHCAGAVRMNLPIDAARAAAVDSARAVISLAESIATAQHLAKVEMISTVGVAGRAHRLLQEEWVGAGHAFHNTYEQAKAEAEIEMRAAIERGLPITVHRPSMVVGDSVTGYAQHFQVFYFLAEFLSGRRTGGIFPDLGDAKLDIVPADFVAEAIARSSRSDANAGRILHLCGGPDASLPLVRLQELMREALAERGERVPGIRVVSRAWFRRGASGLRWLVNQRTRAALGTLPVFLDYLDTDQAFDNVRTREWLGNEGIQLPSPETYVHNVIRYYLDSRRRDLPARDRPTE